MAVGQVRLVTSVHTQPTPWLLEFVRWNNGAKRMPTDSFTNTNFLPVEDHTAGGNTWAGLANVTVFGQISSNQLGFGEAFGVACRAANSTSDFCQVVCKGGDYDGNTKSVLVRSSESVRGYEL